MHTTLTKTQSAAAVKSPAEKPFSDCTFKETICTTEKNFPGAVEEAAITLRQRGLGSAIVRCKSNGGNITDLKESDRCIVDLNYMRKTNPELYKDITTGHFAVFYPCKDSPEVVVLKTSVAREIIKARAQEN